MTPDDDTTFPQKDSEPCPALDELYTENIITEYGDVIDIVNPEQDQ